MGDTFAVHMDRESVDDSLEEADGGMLVTSFYDWARARQEIDPRPHGPSRPRAARLIRLWRSTVAVVDP